MDRDTLLALAERLEKRAKVEREIAANSAVIVALLEPEFAKFEAREAPWNTYAVRMAVEHRHSAKKDAAFADDLDAAVDALRARTQEPPKC
jgi:hypothetical protein